ncbi:MAG: helix-turn-helix transcriptional regulator, partial [Pseudonocardiaceae bacterium]
LMQCLSLGCLALLEAQRGDERACRQHAAESLRLSEAADLKSIARDSLDGLGLLELSLGRPDRAITYLEQANRYHAANAEAPVIGRPSSTDLLEAYVRAGKQAPSTMIVQLHTLTEKDTHQPDTAAALHWRARALLADDDHYDEYFTRALELHARRGSPFDTARTQLCYGERLRRSGRRRGAREHLVPAYETFQRIGARLWAQRAATELSAAGQPASPSPRNPGEDLTAQELQVAQLAARGSTNREIAAQLFLSVKTIEMHLGRVYRKLGVRSRTQLANLLRDTEFA